MRIGAIVREIVLDVLTGTSRTLLLTLIATTVGGGVIVADTLATVRIIDQARDFKGSGAAVLTVTSAGSVSGEACEALNDVPGIDAAGALRKTNGSLVLNLLPAAPLPLYESTAGISAVLGAEGTGNAGALVPDAVIEALGSSMTQPISTDRGQMTVAGTYTYPSDGRRSGFGWVALAPTSSKGMYDECWALVWPSSSDARQLLRSTISADTTRGADTSSQFGQLNARLGETYEGYAAFRARATYGTPLLTFGLGAVLAVAAVWARRLDYAARLHDGMRKSDLQIVQIVETATWSLPAAILAGVTGCFLAISTDGRDALVVGSTAVASSAAIVAGAVIGGVLTTLVIREANLFRYFKNR